MSAEDLAAGALLGRIQVLAPLSPGRWLARQIDLDRLVALQLCDPALGWARGFALARLSHDHLATLYDGIRHGERTVLVCEHPSAPSFGDFAETSGQVDLLRAGHQLVCAVA